MKLLKFKHCNKPVDLSGTIATFAKISDTVPWKWGTVLKGTIKTKRTIFFFVKSLVMVHVALTSLNKNYKEIKSTAKSYNQIIIKKAHHLLMIL